jgi:hypothetical protein
MIIVCYVDDIMGTGTNEKMFTHLLNGLKKELDVVLLGEINGCLGMKVTRSDDGSILLNNEIYVNNMLETFEMTDCNFADTPEVSNAILSKEDCIPRENYDSFVQEKYRSLVGSLLYAAICWRPDIFLNLGCAECVLAKNCACPIKDLNRIPDNRPRKFKRAVTKAA